MLGYGAISQTKSLPLELNSDVVPARKVLIGHRTSNGLDIQRRAGHGAGQGPGKSRL